MARYKGKDGYIEAGDTPVEVGERISWSVDLEAEELDANTQGQNWSAIEVGLFTGSGTIETFRDPADSGQTELALGATVTMSLYPMGDSSGLTEITGDWVITGVGIPSGVGDLVKNTYTFKNSGTITIGTVA